MVRRLIFTILFLLISSRAWAALAVVQHTSYYNAAPSTTQTITLGQATGSNNLLVLAVLKGNFAVTGVSDGTNPFVQFAGSLAIGTTGIIDLWYLPQSTSGKSSVTVTYSANSAGQLHFWEVSGFKNPTSGVTAGGGGTGVGTTDTGYSVTTTANSGFLIGVNVTTDTPSANPAGGNDFTAGGDIDGNGDAAVSLISTAAGTYTPVWTDAGSDQTLTLRTSEFREAVPSTISNARLNKANLN